MKKKLACDGAIFDVDGTLWDSTSVVAGAWNQVIRTQPDLNCRITSEDLQSQFGKPLEEIGRNLIPVNDPKRMSFLLDQILILEDRFLKENPPEAYPGVEETFRSLAQHIPVFIVSNCQSGYIERFLNVTGYDRFITDHLCPGDTGKLKASNIQTIAHQHHLNHPVYIGDTKGDLDACMESGVPFVYAAYGFGKIADPEYSISSPAGLPDLLEFIL